LLSTPRVGQGDQSLLLLLLLLLHALSLTSQMHLSRSNSNSTYAATTSGTAEAETRPLLQLPRQHSKERRMDSSRDFYTSTPTGQDEEFGADSFIIPLPWWAPPQPARPYAIFIFIFILLLNVLIYDTAHRWKKYKKSLIIGVTVLGVVLVGLIITAAVVSTRHTTEPKIRAPKNVVQSASQCVCVCVCVCVRVSSSLSS
jgi:hypothetical protein